MVEFTKAMVKDIGLQREVEDALPYAVVGGTWMGSFDVAIRDPDAYQPILNHVVPAGQQLKMLFLRIWTQSDDGAKFAIVQTNPTATGQTGAVEAYPVVGSVPEGVRDYPMLEAAGAEVLHGSLRDPIHVLEGSIEFRILGPVAASGNRYSLSWWGVEKTPE
jgi:hypothetical protein